MMLRHSLLLAGLLSTQEARVPPRCPQDLQDRPADDLKKMRRSAYDKGRTSDLYILIECEIEARHRESTSVFGRPQDGEFSALCDAIEAAFKTCNNHSPGSGCAADYIERYATEGCLEDFAQIPRYFEMRGIYWKGRINYLRALSELASAETFSVIVFLGNLMRKDQAGIKLVVNSLLDLVMAIGDRVDLAGQLRNRAAVVEQVSRLEASMDRVRAFSEQAAKLQNANARDPAGAPPPDAAPPDALNVLADAQVKVGWALLMMRESGVPAGDPVPWLRSALQTFTSGPRPQPPKAKNIRINLALAALQDGRLAEVDHYLEDLAPDGMTPEEVLWLRLVQARAALAQAQYPLVETRIQELGKVAARVDMGRWYAAWVRGLYFDAVGRPEAALKAFSEADALLEDHAQSWSPWAYGMLADGRFLTLGAASQRLVQLLIETGDPGDAAEAARRVRSRALRMAARGACSTSEQIIPGLPDVQPGELRLLYLRLSNAAPGAVSASTSLWAAFAIHEDEPKVQLLELPPVPPAMHDLKDDELQGWSDVLLAPFQQEIADASSIVILASESLHDVPFHALPWDESILLEAAPVAYGLDVQPCTRDLFAAAENGAAPRALVVHDATRDLTHEAMAVAEVLTDAGVTTDRLAPRSLSGLSGLLDGSYSIAHIVVHGEHAPGAELNKADDRLLFHEAGFSLTRETILASARGPHLVTMSACSSSFADAEMLGGGVSLAHAFLLKGARFVSGAVAPVDGLVAGDFAAEFYRNLELSSDDGVLETWRRAYLAMWLNKPESYMRDLRKLRLYTF